MGAVPAARGGLDPADPSLRTGGHGGRAPRGWPPRPPPHCGTGEVSAMCARGMEGKGWL